MAPQELSAFKVAELTKLVQNHLTPKPSVIVSRYKFNTRNRKEGESVSDYVVCLRQFAKDCDFKTTLNDMLRDRPIQLRLLGESDALTFDAALTKALAMEAAEKNAKDMMVNPSPNPTAINVIKNARNTDLKCYSCGGNHLRFKCKFRDADC